MERHICIRSGWLVAALVALAVAVSSVAIPAKAAPPTDDHTTAGAYAARWLAAQLDAEGWIPDAMDNPSAGQTAAAALAFAANGVQGDEFDAAVSWLEAHVDDYVASFGDDSPGALGNLILIADAAGIDPTSFGGVNLVARLTATLGAGEPGLYGAASATYDGVYRQSLALLGLVTAGVVPDASAVNWLLDQQCDAPSEAAGGWQAYRADTTAPCDPPNPDFFTGPDTNSTAMAISALAVLGTTPATTQAASDAVDFLADAQNLDGGFGYITGGPTDPNSTALVIQGLVAQGIDPTSADWIRIEAGPYDSLMSWQIGCDADAADIGAFSSPYSSGAPDMFATTQGAAALAGVAFPLGEATFSGTAAVPCAPPDQSTSTTSTTSPGQVTTTTTNQSTRPPLDRTPDGTTPAARPMAVTTQPALAG